MIFCNKMGLFIGIIGLILEPHFVSAFKIYQERIPNGDKIPDPCRENQIWNGVGHRKPIGGGNRNPFGVDFERLGKVWDKTLCQKDSDGDGRSNGEELGDPDCNWSVGMTPKQIGNLSHPGICEPLTSSVCISKNEWLNCTVKEFTCDVIKEKGVKNITLRIPRVRVPPVETLYVCMLFKLPTDGDYHIIADTPIIDNDYVLHHIILFGCSQLSYFDIINRRRPYRCGMTPMRACDQMLSIWSFGSKGHCGNPHAGFRIGAKGYKYAAIQIHWNNPEKRKDYRDGSGLVLYYTPNLRQYDAGILTVGQMDLAIPPFHEHFGVTALCDRHCTATIIESNIYVVESLNHMHYLGKAEKVELYRNNKFLQFVTNQENYDYDNPVSQLQTSPVEVVKGDELKTTCTFQSNNTNTTTYFGEDTSAEMCFAFLHYYPKQNLINNYCLSFRSVPLCELFGNNTLRKTAVVNGCKIAEVIEFTKGEIGYILFGVLAKCNAQRCVPDCLPVTRFMLQHPCFQGDMAAYISQAFYTAVWDLSNFFHSKVYPCINYLKYCSNCTAANLSSWYSNNETDTNSTNTQTTSVIYTATDSLMYTNKTDTNLTTPEEVFTKSEKSTNSTKSVKSTTVGISTKGQSLLNTTPSKASHQSYAAMVFVAVFCSYI